MIKTMFLKFFLACFNIKVTSNGNNMQIDMKEFWKKHPKLAESVLAQLTTDLQKDQRCHLTINGQKP